jgi:glycosyltransferase involved in cell wall biosynthesis
MKILSVNQTYSLKGGSDRYFFNMNDLLFKNKHDVVEFAAEGDLEPKCNSKKYFPTKIDFQDKKLKNFFSYLYNFEAKSKINGLLNEHSNFELAHLQIYYGQLTSSILNPLVKRNIPVIQTLHEYKLSCPVYTHISHGEICNKCVSGSSFNCIINRCKSNSITHSITRFLEYNVSRFLGDVNFIDKFICVSEFQMNKMKEAGIPEHKLEVLYNFVPDNNGSLDIVDGDYLLFFGRLEKLKGIHTLIKAMKEHPDKLLVIAGDGPYENELKNLVISSGLSNQVEFCGFVSGDKLWNLVKRSKAIMVPSEWYENCSMTVLEGKSYSKPIIAASIGGITEQIYDGINGFLHKPGCSNSISNAITKLYESDYEELCKASRSDLEHRYSSHVHYPKLMDIYRQVLESKMAE